MTDTINPTTTAPARGTRKQRVGEVVSNKMAKTIVVRVERRFPHAKFSKVVTAYKKFVREQTKHHAHDENEEAKPGDRAAVDQLPSPNRQLL